VATLLLPPRSLKGDASLSEEGLGTSHSQPRPCSGAAVVVLSRSSTCEWLSLQ